LGEPAARSDEEQRFVEALRHCSPEIDLGADLAQAFVSIVREPKASDLDGWIARTREPVCPREMRAVAEGLLKDEAAVRAGLSLPWSNGQVEDQVNRLKPIKRMMYGRGGFDLLRRRVLHRPPGYRQATATVSALSVPGDRLVAAAA
jgi:transposase